MARSSQLTTCIVYVLLIGVKSCVIYFVAVPFYAAQQLHRLHRIPRQLRGATKPVVVTTSKIGEPVSQLSMCFCRLFFVNYDSGALVQLQMKMMQYPVFSVKLYCCQILFSLQYYPLL